MSSRLRVERLPPGRWRSRGSWRRGRWPRDTGTDRRQGRARRQPPAGGHRKRPCRRTAGHPGKPAVDAAAGLVPTGATEFAVRNFGSWVDDAYVLPRGEAWVGLGAGYWRLPVREPGGCADDQHQHRGCRAPARGGDSAVLARRSTPTASAPSGSATRTSARRSACGRPRTVSAWRSRRSSRCCRMVRGRPLTAARSGACIGRCPSTSNTAGAGWRTYGSAGYFSRGAVFGSGTLDISLGARARACSACSATPTRRGTRWSLSGVDVQRSRTDLAAECTCCRALRSRSTRSRAGRCRDRRLRVEVLLSGGRVVPGGPGGESHAVDRAGLAARSRSTVASRRTAAITLVDACRPDMPAFGPGRLP